MSVAMTNCGRQGWVTDRRCYRSERAEKLELLHGDVLVWGGPDRLALSRRYASEGRRACLAGQLPNQSHLPEGG
jgi:alkylated DNA repair dioxygenase AlkB